MRRARQKRPVSVQAIAATTPTTMPVSTLNVVAVAEVPVVDKRLVSAEAINRICTEEPDVRARTCEALEIAIVERIESRLPGRVRNLAVRVFNNVVILEGQCATYYTKQLAQHTAMGIIEDEHLENAIVVSVQP
jgi:hypothetical protein